MDKPLRVALVHDFLIRYGGAERVLHALHEMFPEAPIYTLFADKKLLEAHFPDADVRTSSLDKLPLFLKKRYRYLAPFCIAATENFSFDDFDIVISSSASFMKGIITKPSTLHIWYCHTPTRFLWDWTHAYLRTSPTKLPRTLRRLFLHKMRLWDFEAAQRPDYILANSKAVAERIEKFYRRKANVIYPPVGETSLKANSAVQVNGSESPSKKDFFLIVSYLQNYKHVDIAVDACSKLNLPLVVIGDGPEKKALEKYAGKSVEFLGWQNDAVVHDYLQKCKAFIFPSEDDFGIAPVEAMQQGKPVLALRFGGAKETVWEGVNGEFFDSPHAAVLADGLRRFLANYTAYNSRVIQASAQHFSKEHFIIMFTQYLKRILEERAEIQ